MARVELADGSVIIFRSAGGGDFETQGPMTDKLKVKLLEVTHRAGQVLFEAVSGVRSSLTTVAPDELEIEIGVSLSEEGSIVVSSAKAEASITIKALWKETGSKS